MRFFSSADAAASADSGVVAAAFVSAISVFKLGASPFAAALPDFSSTLPVVALPLLSDFAAVVSTVAPAFSAFDFATSALAVPAFDLGKVEAFSSDFGAAESLAVTLFCAFAADGSLASLPLAASRRSSAVGLGEPRVSGTAALAGG